MSTTPTPAAARVAAISNESDTASFSGSVRSFHLYLLRKEGPRLVMVDDHVVLLVVRMGIGHNAPT